MAAYGASLSTPQGVSKSLGGPPVTANLVVLENSLPPTECITGGTPASSTSSEQSVVQTLMDRVQRLEQALVATSLDAQPSSAGCRTETPAKKDIDRSIWHKTRFYGQSHWVHPFEQAKKLIYFKYLPGGINGFRTGNCQFGAEVNRLVNDCKVMARTIKAVNTPQWLFWIPDVEKSIPSRQLSDQLLHMYFRTSESTCRILHIPSFWKEYEQYWRSPQSASPCSLFKILLAMALGICFYQGPSPEVQQLRSKAQQWIYAAQSWLVMPNEKSRLNISGLQVQCLLLVARSIFTGGGGLIWITARAVLRAAINMGLHRDSKYFPRMSVLQAEVRRRLWASILELNLTNALDSGMSPMISIDDYDTESPLNINDDELTESTVDPPMPKPDNVFTQTSLQLAVLRSLPVRLEVTSMINGFRFEPSYDEAGSDPKYYYSRKIYTDSSVAVLAHPDPKVVTFTHETEGRDDFHCFCLSGSYLKEVMIHAVTGVYLEMAITLEEDPDMTFTQERKQSREPYRRVLEQAIEISRQRIAFGGETNVKGHLFMSVALGHIDAIEAGRPAIEGILEAAQNSAKLCHELLRARLPSTPDMKSPNQQDAPHNGFDADQLNSDMHDNDIDFTMADWGTDFDNIPDAWMFSSWDETNIW